MKVRSRARWIVILLVAGTSLTALLITLRHPSVPPAPRPVVTWVVKNRQESNIEFPADPLNDLVGFEEPIVFRLLLEGADPLEFQTSFVYAFREGDDLETISIQSEPLTIDQAVAMATKEIKRLGISTGHAATSPDERLLEWANMWRSGDSLVYAPVYIGSARAGNAIVELRILYSFDERKPGIVGISFLLD